MYFLLVLGNLHSCYVLVHEFCVHFFIRISEMNLNIDKYKMQVNEKERQLAMLQNQPPPPAHDSPDASIEPSPSRVTFASPQGGQEMEEIEAMHEALRCIAQEVINDTEQATFDDSAAGNGYVYK